LPDKFLKPADLNLEAEQHDNKLLFFCRLREN